MNNQLQYYKPLENFNICLFLEYYSADLNDFDVTQKLLFFWYI